MCIRGLLPGMKKDTDRRKIVLFVDIVWFVHSGLLEKKWQCNIANMEKQPFVCMKSPF